MTFLPHRGARAMTPADLIGSIETRPSSLREYLTAQVREGFWSSIPGQAAAWVGRLRSDDGADLTQEAWRESAHYREGLPWDEGMTEGRARYLAEVFDENQIRRAVAANRNASTLEAIAGFGAGVLGSLPDPINLVPVVGTVGRVAGAGATVARATGLGRVASAELAIRGAATRRFGQVGGGVAMGAAEGALGNLLLQPILLPSRAAFGDDAGLGEAALDVALGAFAGGIFGGGAAALSRLRATPRVRNEAATAASEAADAVAVDRPIDVPPPSPQGVGGTREAVRSTERVNPSLTDPVTGRTRVVTSRGTEIEVAESVVEAADLVTSDRPEFPAGLQPRDRSRMASDLQIEQMAGQIDPAQLTDSRLADTGAPIIGADLVVESGNGRIAALRRAYERGTADTYRAALTDRGYDVSGFAQPVLVRRRVTELDDAGRRQFALEANERATAGFSVVERAAADSRAIDTGMMDLWNGGNPADPANRGFVLAFERDVLSAADRNDFRDAGGTLSRQGADRIVAAILTRAYGDRQLMAQMLEATDSNIRTVGGALADVSSVWARLRGAVDAGLLHPRYDITADLIAAVRTVRRARLENAKLPMLLAQRDLAGGEVSPIAEMLIRLMHRDVELRQALSRERFAAALADYAARTDRIADAGPTLAGLDVPDVSPAELLALTRKAQTDLADPPLPGVEARLTEGVHAADLVDQPTPTGPRDRMVADAPADEALPDIDIEADPLLDPVEDQVLDLEVERLVATGAIDEGQLVDLAAAREAAAVDVADGYQAAVGCLLRASA